MKKLGLYLESAFRSMKIFYQKIENPRQLIYKIVFPESGILCGTVTLVVDEMFSAEISAFIARGVAEDRRISVLEEINRVNDKCCFINVGMDDKNDVYSYQQFILAGDEHIMCKQIVTKLIVFYDMHKRTAEKIYRLISL